MSSSVRRSSRRYTLAVWSGVLLLLVLGLASCAKPPEADMAAAKAAIDDARTKEASDYAPAELKAAEDSLASAQSEIDRQQAKFALFRSYKIAKAKALATAQVAKVAGDKAVANKDQMRKDSEALMAQIEQGITALGERFKTKEVMKLMRAKDKDERAKMEAIKSEADAIPAVLANAKSAYDGQKYKMSLSMSKDAAGKLQSVNSQLDAIVPVAK